MAESPLAAVRPGTGVAKRFKGREDRERDGLDLEDATRCAAERQETERVHLLAEAYSGMEYHDGIPTSARAVKPAREKLAAYLMRVSTKFDKGSVFDHHWPHYRTVMITPMNAPMRRPATNMRPTISSCLE